MKKLIYKALIVFIYFLISSFFSQNCICQWVQTNGPYGNGTIRCFAVSGNNIFGGSYEHGVFISTNNGDSWSQTSLYNNSVISLFANGTTIFAGTTNGAYRTNDNGQNWTNISEGLPYGGAGGDVYSFVSIGVNLIAGTNDGVFVSTNSGNSWS
jgi:hypothetical protein